METDKVSQNLSLRFDPGEIYKSGIGLGTADLFIGGNVGELIGITAPFLLSAIRNKEGGNIFTGLLVITPPKLVCKLTDEEILQLFLNNIEIYNSEKISPETVNFFKSMLSVHRCTLLDVAQVIDAVAAAEHNQLICIIQAAKFRDKSIPVIARSGVDAVMIAEDEWVPHLASLARDSLSHIKISNSYLLIETSEIPPVRQSNQKLLNDIDGLYPVLIESKLIPNDLVINNSERWVALAVTGRLEEVLAEIENAEIHQDFKIQLSIQFISRTGNYEFAAQRILEEHKKGIKFPAEMSIRFGSMAERGGQEAIAKTLLLESIPSVSDRHLLEAALRSATSLEDTNLIDLAYEQLIALYPDSEFLKENQEYRLMHWFLMALNTGQIDPSKFSFSESNLFLIHSLSGKGDVVYEELLDRFSEKWPEDLDLAKICCAMQAQANEQYIDSIELAIATNSEKFERQASQIILHAVRRMMLVNEVPDDQIEFYKLPLRFVIDYLSRNPRDSSCRGTLARTLSVEACGSIGMPIIASLALDIAQEGSVISEHNERIITVVEEEEFKKFFTRAFQWLGNAPILELGVTYLPKELVGQNPLGLIEYIVQLIRVAMNQPKEDPDMTFLESCAHLLCLLGIYAEEDMSDIDVLRLFAARLWLDGQSQKARDIAEQTLLMARSKPRRHRLAWASFADIYHRTRDPIQALIGISCAIACKTDVEIEELSQETQTLLRITRDLGLRNVAKRLIPKCRELFALQGLEVEGNLRVDTMELGLRLGDVRNENNVGLEQLLHDVTKHCQKVVEQNDELLPVAVLLAQTVELSKVCGLSVGEDSLSLLDMALQRGGPRLESYFRTVSKSSPTAGDLISLHQRQDIATNSEDIAGDFAIVVMAARRLLESISVESAPEDVALSIELLAEKSIDIQHNQNKLSADWPASYVCELSRGGINIALLGLSESGDLIAVIAQNGNLDIRQSSKTQGNFLSHLNKWSVQYPYKYGLIDRDEGNNEFYISMELLDIPLPNGSELLVIAEPILQQIPMNLVLSEGKFLGTKIPIGIAPSLTWLHAVRSAPVKHDGRRLAWISASALPEQAGTLEAILGRLQPTFDMYGFHTDTSRHIPKTLSGAQMVVVTAHGGLTAEERFIHKISDEGTLVESPLLLAQSLQNVEVVILFVCSGGRLDRHPLANTSVGLPKLLLDCGCRAVIASPWPLAALVTYRWFESFMEAWDGGETLLSATFRGNCNVQKALGDPPQYGLAMVAYGNVLLKNS